MRGVQHAEIIEKLKEMGVLFEVKGELLINPSVQLNAMERSFGFQDVAIKQRKNKCISRLDVDIRAEVIRGVELDVPMIAANMSSVTNGDFCVALAENGAMGVLHRAATDEWIVDEVKKIAEKSKWVAAAIGLGDDQVELAKKIVDAGGNILVVDIAHGYSDAMVNMTKTLKKIFPEVKVVVGNTVNPDIMEEVADYSDAVKCGIAQGAACSTKNTAGATEKQFSAILKFKAHSQRLGLPIISDGGVREPADFSKAIAAGANSIMAGKIFAACPESAAELVNMPDGSVKKHYFGMASRTAQNRWKCGLKPGTCPEGIDVYLELGESLVALLERYSGALRSGITYGGEKNIQDFQKYVQFVRLN